MGGETPLLPWDRAEESWAHGWCTSSGGSMPHLWAGWGSCLWELPSALASVSSSCWDVAGLSSIHSPSPHQLRCLWWLLCCVGLIGLMSTLYIIRGWIDNYANYCVFQSVTLLRMFKRTGVLIPYTLNQTQVPGLQRTSLYQMEVYWVFDVRKCLLVGISLPARMCKLNTQSLAHAVPHLCISAV